MAAASLMLCGATLALADYPTYLQSLSPLGHWQLNETGTVPPATVIQNLGSLGATDNGAPVGGALLGVPGVLTGNTAIIVTNGSHAAIPYDANLNPATFSAEGWFRPTFVSGTTCCMAQFVEGTRAGWLVYMVASGWSFRLYNQNGTTFSLNVTTTTAPVVGNWYHIVVTFDGTTGTIYVNDVATSGTATGYVPNPSNPFTVGERSDNAFGWPGTADEAAIYSGVLSAARVAAHYSAGTAGDAAAYKTAVLADAPLGYWRLDEAPYAPLVAANSGTMGSAHDGAYSSSGSTSDVAGPQSPAFAGFAANNKAASFDGNSGSIDIPPLGITTDRITMTAWVKSGTMTAWDGIVMNRNPANSAVGFDVQNDTGLLALNWEDTEWGWDYAPESPTLPAGQWAFVAFTADPTTDAIYVSDPNNPATLIKKVFSPIVNNVKTLNGTFAIGRDPGTFGTGRCFGGDIDEVAVFGTAMTEGQILTLYYAAIGTNAPIILTQPSAPAGTIYSGNTFSFTVDAAGTPALGYQWRKGGSPLTGATQATYTQASASAADDGSYDVVITNPFGTVTSTALTITVSPVTAPTITAAMSPASATRIQGGSMTWSVGADGTSPYTYIWKKGTSVLAANTTNEKTNTFTKASLGAGDAGIYSVTVTNIAGPVNGGTSTLALMPASTPGLPGAIAALGPYVYYRLNEAPGNPMAADLVQGLDGTVSGAPTQAADGPRPPAANGLEPSNYSYEFGGNANAGEVILPALNFTRNQATITCWVYRMGDQPDYAGVVYWRGAGTSAGLSVTSDNRPVITWGDVWYEYGKTPLGPAVLPDSTWAFVAMVVETNQYTMYMDDGNGLKSGTFATQWTTDSSGSPYTEKTNTFAGTGRIAHDSGSAAGRYFGGRIDEVAVFAKSLTPAEIQSISDAGWSAMTTAPRIGVQPVATNYYVGGPVQLSVGASGSPTMAYQWYKGATPVAGGTGATLTIASAATTDSGSYTVVITNSLGTATSTAAAITINPLPVGISVYRKAVFADHPVVYYPMDDQTGATALAEVYNATVDDAPISGAPALQQDGATAYTGKSVGFDPINVDGANIGDPAVLDMPGSLTCEAWIKPLDTRPGTFGNILAKGYGGYYNGEQQMRVDNGFYDFGSYSDATGGDGVSAAMPAGDVGAWVHLVGVYDGKAYRLYRNGVQFAVSNDDFRFDHVTPNWGLGVRGDGSERIFYGGIDEAAIYNYALTPFKVKNHYAVGTTGVALVPTVSIASSGGNVVITWDGNGLESADEVTGSWTPVTGATSPLTVPATAARKFYRAY